MGVGTGRPEFGMSCGRGERERTCRLPNAAPETMKRATVIHKNCAHFTLAGRNESLAPGPSAHARSHHGRFGLSFSRLSADWNHASYSTSPPFQSLSVRQPRVASRWNGLKSGQRHDRRRADAMATPGAPGLFGDVGNGPAPEARTIETCRRRRRRCSAFEPRAHQNRPNSLQSLGPESQTAPAPTGPDSVVFEAFAWVRYQVRNGGSLLLPASTEKPHAPRPEPNRTSASGAECRLPRSVGRLRAPGIGPSSIRFTTMFQRSAPTRRESVAPL